MSDFEKVKAATDLNAYAEANLDRAKRGNKYVCPICGSGGKGNPGSDSAFSITSDGKRWTCFGSCGGKGGDIFDLAGAIHNTTDQNEQLRIVAEFAGVTLESDRGGTGGGFKEKWSARSASETATDERKEKKATDTPKDDYTAGRERHRRYIAECAARLKDEPTEKVISFLSARGITYDEAVKLGFGYDPQHKTPWTDSSGKKQYGARLIIPFLGCDYYHSDRALSDDVAGGGAKYAKPRKEDVGKAPLYNAAAFDGEVVIAVEGEMDAIALGLCGYNAVGINGIAGVGNFVNEAVARNYSGVVVEMLDCDDDGNKGQRAGRELVSQLEENGITTLSREEYGIDESDDYGGHKDAGEYFASNRDGLAQMLEYMKQTALDKAQRAKDKEYREALRNLHVKDPAQVARDVYELRDVYEPVPTGIKSLDDVLGGGVSLGELTIFGAISSYGKTTLAVQIADHMAAAGRSVLFVTIEQSAKELIAKSLSRMMFLSGNDYDGGHVTAPNEITSLKERKEWNMFRNESLREAVTRYGETIAPNLRILEGSNQPTVADVRAISEKMKEHDGVSPIIFIDYLQLLAPLSVRYDTDKRNADMNVSELRKMARDLNTHIWCISSLNRESYTNGVTMTAFKESGSLEFGSDNLMGLQMLGMSEILEKISGSDAKVKREVAQRYQENKSKIKRACELVILKQRNGALPNEPLPITFNTVAAYFTEPATAKTKEHKEQTRTVL